MSKKYFNSNDARRLITHYGLSLFPIQGINEDGGCTCGDPQCTNKGKHPATATGFKEATKDIEKLKALWAGRKWLNVGIATGEPSGIFVIDIDSDEGEHQLAALGELPETLTVKTGKGRHLYYLWPGEPVITKRGILNGVDVRGDGGYVAGPGSNHLRGNVYDFDNPLIDIAAAPEWILNLVVKSRIISPKEHTSGQLQIVNSDSGSLHLRDGWTIEQVREHLQHISPDIGRDEWVQIGMALKSEGMPFQLWDQWSRGGAKYKQSEMVGVWNSFKGSGTSYGTVVHLARQGGWQPRSYAMASIGIGHTSGQQLLTNVNNPIVVSHETLAQHPDNKPGETQNTQRPRTIQYVMSDQIVPNIEANDFVQNYLGEGQMSVVYGESNCGKTFFMTDMAFHVALGKRWRDLRVERGGVIYVALEGSYGLRNRITAFKHEYPEAKDGMPLAMITSQIDFMNPDGNIAEFIDVIMELREKLGSVRLVVIDTLARAMAGGDENSGQDMGMLVRHGDLIRAATGAHVCFVHHSGKDKALGARGHSSLRAAIDTEIEVSREDGAAYSMVRTVKQREMEAAEPIYFGLKRVTLGVNRYNEEVTSCVVETVDAASLPKTDDKQRLSANQAFVMDAILEAMDGSSVSVVVYPGQAAMKCIDYETLRKTLLKRGFAQMLEKENDTEEKLMERVKSTTQTVRVALRDKNKIGFNRTHIWLA